MISGPLVSVVVPLYNKVDYVSPAIESVLSQTRRDFEVVVVDDGSTDGSFERVIPFTSDRRVKVLRQANRGAGAARNIGVANSRGDLICFLDADDEWLPWALEKMITIERQFPTAGILAAGFDTVDSQNKRRRFVHPSVAFTRPLLIDTGQYFRFETLARNPASTHMSACAIRRKLFQTLGGFIEASLGEDQEYLARVCLRYPLAYDPETISVYRVGVPHSAVNNPAPAGWYPPVVRTIKQYLASHPDCKDRQSIRDYAAEILLNHVARTLQRGSKAEALELLRDDILEECSWQSRIWRLRVGSRLPPRLIRTYVAARRAGAA